MAIVLFASAALHNYLDQREERRAMTEVQAQKTLLSFEAQSRRLFDYGDGVLKAMRGYYALRHQDGLSAFLADIYAPHAESFSGTVTIADGQGLVQFHSNETWTPGTSLAEREYFRTFRSNPADFLYIGPTDYGVVTHQWWFRLVRPILRNNGLDGVMILTLRPENITAFFEDLSQGAHSAASVATLDNRLIARMPAAPERLYGKPIEDPTLRALLKAGPTGSYHAASPVDGVERTYYVKRLDDYPVVVMVGIADIDVEAGLAGLRRNVILQVVMFSVAAVLFCLLLLRMGRKNQVLAEMEAASAAASQALRITAAQQQATAARLKLVVETAAEGMVGLDDEGRVMFANKAAAEMLAWTATEAMQGRPSFEALGHHLADGRTCDRHSCAIRLTLTDGVTRRVAGESFRSQSGQVVSVDYAVSPLIVEGTPVGGVVIFHDVGERRAAEARVKSLLSYQQAILDNAPVGIAVYDQHRRLVEANPAFLAIFGWLAEDIIGQNSRALYLDDESYEASGEWAYPVIRQGKSFRGDTLMRRHDGREIWVRLTGHLVDGSQPERGVIWATEDITERKALELDLKRSNEELERFAYVASHDLRQPLRMVSGYLSLLERQLTERLDDEERSFIGFAVDGAKRMDKMIVDLLDYSRIGRQPSEKLPVDLNAELAHALGNLDLLIEEAEAEVVVPEPLPTILGYDTELERLLQNLIGNAIKFRAEGRKPVVTITCHEDGRNWVLAIQDNGIGIAPKDHARLFRVFQRLVSREQYDGTGIGLAACRKIAEHHGGRIWVESEIGEGCTFLVALPVV